jgi:hypothetical protein
VLVGQVAGGLVGAFALSGVEDPALKSNTTFSHPWAGSPAYLVYRGALGIQALEPGYKRFAVRPQPGGLTHAEGVTPTVRGPIAAAFATADGGKLDLSVSVPANTSSRVTLPGSDPTVYVDHRARTGTVGPDGVSVDVEAGCHLVSTRAASGTPDSVLAFAVAHGCDTTAPVLTLLGEERVTAGVISTAGDTALTVSDPGHLTNGAFTLPEPLSVEFSKATWTAPVANDPVTIAFKQHIGATDPLRTGAYSTTLTFTLSTTTP